MPESESAEHALSPWDRFLVWFECLSGRVKLLTAGALVTAAVAIVVVPSGDGEDAPPLPPGAPVSEGAPATGQGPIAPPDGEFIR